MVNFVLKFLEIQSDFCEPDLEMLTSVTRLPVGSASKKGNYFGYKIFSNKILLFEKKWLVRKWLES